MRYSEIFPTDDENIFSLEIFLQDEMKMLVDNLRSRKKKFSFTFIDESITFHSFDDTYDPVLICGRIEGRINHCANVMYAYGISFAYELQYFSAVNSIGKFFTFMNRFNRFLFESSCNGCRCGKFRSRFTKRTQRANLAKRNSGKTDGCTDIHQGVKRHPVARMREEFFEYGDDLGIILQYGIKDAEGEPADNPANVGIDRRTGSFGGKCVDGRGGIRAHAFEHSPILFCFRHALLRDLPGGISQIKSASVVPESCPSVEQFRRLGVCQCFPGGKTLEPRGIKIDHSCSLCLLQHDFADENAIRIINKTPWQCSPMALEPG